MQEAIVQSFVSGAPQVAALWLAMLTAALLGAALLSRTRRLPPAGERAPAARTARRAAGDRAAEDPAAEDWAAEDPAAEDWAAEEPAVAGWPATASLDGGLCAADTPDNDGGAERQAENRAAENGAAENWADADWAAEDWARTDEAPEVRGQRYADEVAVAADRAAATARRRRAEWEQAQEDATRQWEAFDAADHAAGRAALAASFVAPADADPVTPPADLVDRERFLHRAATAACRRRELTMADLNEILAHRNGWNPARHPAVQEAALARLVRERCLAAYRLAAARERQAWHTAEVAAAALSSLRAEAGAARLRVGAERTAGQLWWAEHWSSTAPDGPDQEPLDPAPDEATTTVVLTDDIATTVPMSVDVTATVPLPLGVLTPVRPRLPAQRTVQPDLAATGAAVSR